MVPLVSTYARLIAVEKMTVLHVCTQLELCHMMKSWWPDISPPFWDVLPHLFLLHDGVILLICTMQAKIPHQPVV